MGDILQAEWGNLATPSTCPCHCQKVFLKGKRWSHTPGCVCFGAGREARFLWRRIIGPFDNLMKPEGTGIIGTSFLHLPIVMKRLSHCGLKEWGLSKEQLNGMGQASYLDSTNEILKVRKWYFQTSRQEWRVLSLMYNLQDKRKRERSLGIPTHPSAKQEKSL